MSIGYKTDNNYGQFTTYFYGNLTDRSYKGVCYYCYDGIWTKKGAHVLNSDFVDIPSVTIPAGDFVITPTNIDYQTGDIPVAYGTGGHSGHMIVTPHVAAGKWGITRRNPYAAPLESTAVKLYILR